MRMVIQWDTCQATLTYSEATKDELIKKYSKELEAQISRLLDDLKTLKDEVCVK